jgi:hypothetical protein
MACRRSPVRARLAPFGETPANVGVSSLSDARAECASSRFCGDWPGLWPDHRRPSREHALRSHRRRVAGRTARSAIAIRSARAAPPLRCPVAPTTESLRPRPGPGAWVEPRVEPTHRHAPRGRQTGDRSARGLLPAPKITSVDAVQSRSRAGSRRLPADACTPRRPRSPRSPRRGGRHEHPHPCGSTAGAAR